MYSYFCKYRQGTPHRAVHILQVPAANATMSRTKRCGEDLKEVKLRNVSRLLLVLLYNMVHIYWFYHLARKVSGVLDIPVAIAAHCYLSHGDSANKEIRYVGWVLEHLRLRFLNRYYAIYPPMYTYHGRYTSPGHDSCPITSSVSTDFSQLGCIYRIIVLKESGRCI